MQTAIECFAEVSCFTYGLVLSSALRTRASIREGEPSSCSQTRNTTQPCLRNAAVTNLSLTMFFASFSCQKAAFVAGAVEWSGHECQKQPSMNNATLREGKMKSGLALHRSR
jgi:hypothetical protein